MGARNPGSDAPLMGLLKSLLIILLIGYVGLVALMYFAQRALMYFPDTTRWSLAEVGLPQAEEVVLSTSDGEKVIVWHAPPRGEKPVVLYFQGNGGGLNLRAGRFARLVSNGTGLVALNYRGYGGSTGYPTEAGLLRDADAAYAFAAERYGAERIVLWGESLGTGVAVAVAAEHPVARVLLESPFTSTVDVATSVFWYVPIRWLMLDQFRSDERIAKVTAPVMIVHGDGDRTVPFALGERLYSLVRSPKRFMRLPNAGHNDHDEHGLLEKVRSFIDGSE
jgi:fermentation-respiration switch protein FrsA (DUF1100 family)